MTACKSCRYWERVSDELLAPDESTGRCRREPPKRTDDEKSIGEWPWTYEDDWCGEHREREET